MKKVKMVCMAKKLDTMTVQQFSEYWKNVHAKMDLQYKKLRSYRINIIYPELNENPPYDGSCEMYWDSYEEMQEDFASDIGQRAMADGGNFISASVSLVTFEEVMK